jgi:very-short-patch-repair endonuclease
MGTTVNRKHQTSFRRHLRTHSTRAEIMLWLNLKGRQLLGYKFRRQYGVGCYVVDFYCPELRLAIEVDGASHEGPSAQVRDRKRQAEIERHHIRVFRLTDDEVLGNVEKAVMAIEAEVRRIRDHPCPLLDVRRGVYGGV